MSPPIFLTALVSLATVFGIYWVAPALYFPNPVLFITVFISSAITICAFFASFAVFAIDDDVLNTTSFKRCLIGLGAYLGISILAIMVPIMLTFLPGQAQKIGDVLGTPVKMEEQRLPNLDIQNAPLVPENLARRKAELALASIGSKASQLTVGQLVKQEVKGQLIWVAYLEPSGFFRWLDMDGSPGYITVSASDHSDVKLVTSLDEKPIHLRYTRSAFFNNQVERKAWIQHPSLRFADFTPEIDDEGKPFYVASIVEPTVAQSGLAVVGVLVLDPQTGETQKYSVTEAPAWVDIIQSEEIMIEQIENAGDFPHGRFNWAALDKFEPSSFDQVFAKGGKSYWVAGITSRANTSGVQRFLFIDTRTKEIFEYAVNGILENRAAQIVLDSHTKVYDASNPVPFLVNGRPTYVMSLSLGDAIYGYGMVDIESETVFSSKQTLTETLQAYLAARTNSGLPGQENAQNEEFSGRLFRIGQDAKSGNYNFLLANHKEVFVAGSSLSDYLSLAQPGDEIYAKGQRFNGKTINVVSFTVKNLEQ